jgi:hypothetical protein
MSYLRIPYRGKPRQRFRYIYGEVSRPCRCSVSSEILMVPLKRFRGSLRSIGRGYSLHASMPDKIRLTPHRCITHADVVCYRGGWVQIPTASAPACSARAATAPAGHSPASLHHAHTAHVVHHSPLCQPRTRHALLRPACSDRCLHPPPTPSHRLPCCFLGRPPLLTHI